MELRKLDVELLKLQRGMRYEDWRLIITAISVAIGVFGFCFADLRHVMEPLARV